MSGVIHVHAKILTGEFKGRVVYADSLTEYIDGKSGYPRSSIVEDLGLEKEPSQR